MDKYYTPELEEFFVGFEYEEIGNIGGWFKQSFGDSNGEYNNELSEVSWGINHDKIRVKYLSQENVENLGFNKRLKNQWVGWKDYIKEITNSEYEYFMRVTLHTPTMGDLYKIYVHRHLHSDQDDIEGQINYGESELVYKGLIKNKSELIKLLKQLGIE